MAASIELLSESETQRLFYCFELKKSSLIPCGPHNCTLWPLTKNGIYPNFQFSSHILDKPIQTSPHIVAFYKKHRQLPTEKRQRLEPQKYEISHICHQRNCCEVTHLCRETTQQNNARKRCNRLKKLGREQINCEHIPACLL